MKTRIVVAYVVFFLSSAVGQRLLAQESRTSELHGAVERYLGEKDDDAAAKLLTEIVARPDATADAVASALRRSEIPIQKSMRLLVPHKGQHLEATVLLPDGHDRTKPPLPVVFDIASGDVAETLGLSDVIVCFVKGYTPPQFSDEGRDGFLKVARAAAHAANGDPNRLWLCGFSWAAHASFDTAMHRPGMVTGIVPLAGGPRRTHFRLLKHLDGVTTLSFCGGHDDAELVWNLQEIERLGKTLSPPPKFTLDPDASHTPKLKGIESVAAVVKDTPARSPLPKDKGTIFADAPFVESPLLRFDAVDDAKVKPPARVQVGASASQDDQRRAVLKGLENRVAKLNWTRTSKKDEVVLSITADSAKSATIFLRESDLEPGKKTIVRAGTKQVFGDILTPNVTVMLEEARRTGDRAHPVIARFALKF